MSSSNVRFRLTAVFAILLFLVLSAVSQAKAFQNPLLHVCRNTGGVGHVFVLASIPDDQFLICKYSSAYVDVDTVIQSQQNIRTMALAAYLSSGNFNADRCSSFNGVTTLGADLEGNRFEFCQFEDRSMIENSTLTRGFANPLNQTLNEALSL